MPNTSTHQSLYRRHLSHLPPPPLFPSSTVIHARIRLVTSRTTLRLPQQTILLLLHQSTARTAGRAHAVTTSVAADAVFVAVFIAFEGLQDPLRTEHGEGGVGEALW